MSTVHRLATGPHTDGGQLPAAFAQGKFTGQHGSWNRRPHSGYKLIFEPYRDGKPAGRPAGVVMVTAWGTLVSAAAGGKAALDLSTRATE